MRLDHFPGDRPQETTTMFALDRPSRATLVAIAMLMLATVATARVISYSPYSDRVTVPAQQHRMNRYFVLMESVSTPTSPIMAPTYGYPSGQLVVYDSSGAAEPRVVLPNDGSSAIFTSVAVRETNGTPVILAQSNVDLGTNPTRQLIWVLSIDGGTTWKTIGLPNGVITNLLQSQVDVGGPFIKSRYSPIRIGTAANPFVVDFTYYYGSPILGPIPPPPPSAAPNMIYAVGADGSAKQLLSSTTTTFFLAGSDRDGSRMLVRGPQDTLSILDMSGNLVKVAKIDTTSYADEGWITPSGDVFLDERPNGQVMFSRYSNGVRTFAMFQPSSFDALGIFAIPTYDYSGAWIIQRGGGHPTNLSLHDGQNVNLQWSDITAPEVEALHAGMSGNLLLVQVHRSRPQADQRIFKDPALAFWKTGDPAPQAYDELFMNEQPTKAFVHLYVEGAQAGSPFVFDSGTTAAFVVTPISGPASGGSDVLQEWGVVRASFTQHLVLPGVGRTPGAYGSYWMSDLIIHNPMNAPQKVNIRFLPNGPLVDAIATTTTLTLQPHEIRVVPDSLKTLFGAESGSGAYFIDPESGVNATSRTYTKSGNGTYGFGMNAIDVYAGSASPRFPVTFSGAFAGPNFRTNLIMTDVSGRGTDANATALGFAGVLSGSSTFRVTGAGQEQFNSIAAPLGLTPSDAGALVIQPINGQAIASVFTIDNRTNDPTYFPPDLPSPVVRTIPAIGHVDGANNSRYRSDLYIYNPSSQTRTLTMQMKMWDTPDTQTINFTMLPNEARVIPDVLFRLFNRTGIARLRYQSSQDSSGVRVTSRTYSVDANGGTYGFLMPPLNNFQTASSGDTLEILGVVGGSGFRTNIGLVELSAFTGAQPANVRVEIIDDKGVTIDSFSVNVPSAGGMQLTDIFHARNLGDGPAAALIRISPTSGMIGAYATVNDNVTNDPTYLAANLGASQ
jgi:hypothetical protein